MPKITSITEQVKRKDRCNLFVDGSFFASVSLITIMKNRIKVGDEIEEKALKELVEESERSIALNKAAEYLSKSLRTKRQVKEYLLKKGYDEQVVWYCIDKLKEYEHVIIAGEALSHCVANTIRDLAVYIPAHRMIVLIDCTSNVIGFEEVGNDFVNEFRAKGVQFVDSNSLILD